MHFILYTKSEIEQKCYTFVYNFVYSSFSHTINIVVCSTVPLFGRENGENPKSSYEKHRRQIPKSMQNRDEILLLL